MKTKFKNIIDPGENNALHDDAVVRRVAVPEFEGRSLQFGP